MAELKTKPNNFDLKDNTASKVVKSNPKDTISVEIGDSKQPDFKPQVKMMRWNNEVNFSLRAQEDPTATVESDGSTIKYKAKDYEVHMYEKPDAGEDGGYEFEWLLTKKPKTNVLTATIQTKGLDFFYQPALTADEVKQGAVRPDNVVGSYAVYHNGNPANYEGGTEYKTGKAFHIYRPQATDANGNQIWGDINIDTDNGLLTVTLDEKWLQKASYPVVVDPTFGYTSEGGSTSYVIYSTDVNTYRRGFLVTTIEAGTVTALTASLVTNNTSAKTTTTSLLINQEDSGGSNIHGLIGSGEASLTFGTSKAWRTISGLSIDVSSGINYILSISALGPTVSGNSLQIGFDTTVGSYFFSETFSSGGSSAATYTESKENPWTTTKVSATYSFSIYATYTASGGGSGVADGNPLLAFM